jgi:predicted outer membrane protein
MHVLTSLPRLVRWVVAAAVLGAFATAVFQISRADYAAAGSAPEGWTATQFGPLGPADRDLLSKVRLAGLWEMPTGQEMQQRADSERVREVGRLIAKEHAELDRIVRDAASKLDVALPNQPSQEQQGWMAEISASSGTDYDKVAINRLRAAHGKVLPIISQVRSGTRNDVVRKLAVTAAEFVNRHHMYLESSGLVDFSALPEPPHASSAGPHNVAQVTSSNTGVGAMVFLAAMLAIVGMFAFVRGSLRRDSQVALAGASEEHGPRHAARRW